MLPSPLTSLIGREREAQALAELLERARLVTLLGPGGVGKTRLAVHVAHEVAQRYPDGARFVDLAPLSDPALVLPAVARALEVGPGGEGPLVGRLGAALAGRRMLLVLDNFERLLAAGPELAALLAAAPGLTALVTSRAALRLSGERELPLEPLALPEPAPDASLARGAAKAPAVRLFVERAAAVRPGFAPDAAGLAAVAALCPPLHGPPLAIELAAARPPASTPAEILARLARRLPLLSGGPRDAPERQRALRDTIAWSYELLGAAEARLLRGLAVFSGGCGLGAALAVCGRPGEDELALIDRLEALAAHSLVQMREAAGEPRYLMLETLREYAAELLAADPEAPAVYARHAAWAHGLVQRAYEGLTGPDQRAWYERVEAEHDNLRAALGWAAAHDPALALGIAWPLWRFWWQRGYVAEGRAWLARTLALAPPALDGGAPTAHAVDVAQGLHSAGNLAWAEADYEAALGHFQQGMAIRRAIGDEQMIMRGQYAVAMALSNLERYDEALPLYKECLAYERRHEAFEDMVGTLNNLGYVHQQRGDHEAAYSHFYEAATLSRGFGDAARTAQKLVFAAEALLELGRTAEALPLLEEALGLARDSGGHLVLIEALEGVACALAAAGDAARAVGVLGAAEAARRRRGLVLSPDDYPRLVRAARQAHAQLGGAEFARLWAAATEGGPRPPPAPVRPPPAPRPPPRPSARPCPRRPPRPRSTAPPGSRRASARCSRSWPPASATARSPPG